MVPSDAHDHADTYDYVIVGAGSAGCVMAARLSEDPAARVLLLEAGPPDRARRIAVPGVYLTLVGSIYDWGDSTSPQRHAGERTLVYPRGRTLGGTSSINGMLYGRGDAVVYDAWRDEYGCTGWGHADLLPHFRRAEDQQRGASHWHGAGGPLRVEDQRHLHPIHRAWVSAAVAHGLPANDDFAAGQYGAGFFQTTQRRGRRWSAADAYLRPAAARANLAVETGALVTGVELAGGRAVGVRYRGRNGGRLARAGREVILCAGAIGSPHLLLLSGIGPAGHLREHGIEVTVDSPRVGEGLQDHPLCTPMWRLPGMRNLWEEAKARNVLRWALLRRGPLAGNGGGSMTYAHSRPDLPAPDLQYGALPAPVVDQGRTMPRVRRMSVLVAAVRPRSRGRVRLVSADPEAAPLIDPALLADGEDCDVLATGIEQVRRITACEPLATLTDGEDVPGADVTGEALRRWVRGNVHTLFHPTSTCAMGGDEETVCDPQLRVRGVEGLRVVDASVMPTVPNCPPNAPTIALAERAAELVTAAAS